MDTHDKMLPVVPANAVIVKEPRRNLEPILVSAQLRLVVPTPDEAMRMIYQSLRETMKKVDMIKRITDKSQQDVQQKSVSQKRYLSVKDLAEMYSISDSQQKALRGRVKNPLPFYQDGSGGKIRYNISEIEDWMGQQKIR